MNMGRPAIARAIKRSRLRAAEMAADCAGGTPENLRTVRTEGGNGQRVCWIV